ncbi:cupin domain-containing protein [Hymenobacter jejuensis]|uniref:Cupin domain-containing protein n=1 Tax=Hymenobacter jejuensis TaxID=2502781 RepID=A0A5B8A1D9_9BACT|nr:cupin domain-containing protein [Hymenobacter jejuensis]QDA60545.1 hypothetical protein FHG12_10685 [Hymenobacter jejuensis]
MTSASEASPRLNNAPQPILAADLTVLDLVAAKLQLLQAPAWQTSDRSSSVLFKSEGIRLVMMVLRKGAELKTHTAPGTLSVQVLEGHISFYTEQQSADLQTDHVLTLPPGVPHRVVARQESVFLLTIAIPVKTI